MSKHRHRDKEKEGNTFNKNPFGIDQNQLIGMLGNVDMGSVNNIINSMNQNGVDINSLGNMGNSSVNHKVINQNSMIGLNNLNDIMGCANINNKANIKVNSNDSDNKDDENLKLLFSLRDIVNEDRISFIDKIIDLYKKGIFKDV